VLLLTLVMALAGCNTFSFSGSRPAPVSSGGSPCQRACERDYAVCQDAEPAHRFGSDPQWGAAAACSRQIDRCLRRCAPPAEPEPQERGTPETAPRR